MGESKRRKKLLGDAYGNTPAVLKDGSSQLEKQIEKFVAALNDQFEDMANELDLIDPESGEVLETPGDDIPPEKAREQSQRIRAWIHEYLAPFRPQDREKLVIGLLEPIYEDLFDFAEGETSKKEVSEEFLQEFMMGMLHTLSIYSMAKPFLSEENQEFFKKPLYSFYELMREDVEAENDEQKLVELQELFAPCLD